MNRTSSHYRPDIDGLRAIAVGAVLIYHAFPARLPGGFIGVDVFFVISGYLISGIILAALNAGRFSFSHFYARRIRRIFPALAIVLSAVMIGGWFLLYADDYARVGRHVAAGAGFVSNFVLWQEASYFDVAANLKPLQHLWSLGIEEQFYLAWPLILVIASRWRRGPITATCLIGSISFLVAIWTVRIDRTPAFFAPWTRFWELLAGATLACIEADAQLERWRQELTSSPLVKNALAIGGVLMIAMGVSLTNSTRVFPGLWVLLPVAGTFFVMAAGPAAAINRTVLSWPLVVWVGLISYPLYLWHWPLLSFAHILAGDIPPASMRLLLLAASVLLAWGTYRLIERPIRFSATRRSFVPALAAAMSVVCAAGVGLYASGGLIDRPVNRNDAARLVDFYERMHKTGLAGAYHYECDFMDTQTEHVRESIDPSCTEAGRAHTVLLWGDSFAQALSLGLRESLPAGSALAQIATSACKAEIDHFDLSVKERRCEKANRFAMDSIGRLHPDVVVIAQSGGQTVTDWPVLTARVLALGAKHVVVVGPFPLWQPSLPRVYAGHHMQDHADYVGTGIDLQSFDNDRTVAARVNSLAHVTYLSLLDQLCKQRACLARVPGENPLDLMALDFGHLTPKGSSYLGRLIWQPILRPLLQ